MADVLESLSRQSGVPLTTSPDILAEEVECHEQEVELRSELELMQSEGRAWTRRGDAYLLLKVKSRRDTNRNVPAT